MAIYASRKPRFGQPWHSTGRQPHYRAVVAGELFHGWPSRALRVGRQLELSRLANAV
jgi:hypothetical protein